MTEQNAKPRWWDRFATGATIASAVASLITLYFNYRSQYASIDFNDQRDTSNVQIAGTNRVQFHLWNTGTVPATSMHVYVDGGAEVPDVPPTLPPAVGNETVLRKVETDWNPIGADKKHMLFRITYWDGFPRRRKLCVFLNDSQAQVHEHGLASCQN